MYTQYSARECVTLLLRILKLIAYSDRCGSNYVLFAANESRFDVLYTDDLESLVTETKFAYDKVSLGDRRRASLFEYASRNTEFENKLELFNEEIRSNKKRLLHGGL